MDNNNSSRPDSCEKNPEVSIVLPCFNEEEAIGDCIKKIKEVLNRENIDGEIIVVDNNSTDNSKAIASKLGARVLFQPVQGYGAAYLMGIGQARGKYIVIGDADDSYNFYDIPLLLKNLKEGYDLILASRFNGQISKGAMSFSHRFIGNPVISFVFRVFFHTNLSDVLTGMRAFTKKAYGGLHLQSLGMEFGIEMIFTALQKKLKIVEIPTIYNPRKGKSKLKPFHDAWRYFRFMFIFSPDTLYLLPGCVLTLGGLSILLLLARGDFIFIGHKWGIHAVVLASLLTLLGFQIINIGAYAKVFAVRERYLEKDKIISFLTRHFKLEIGILIGGIIFTIGFFINFVIFLEWWKKFFGPLYRIKEAILAMTFMVLGIQVIFSSFFLSLLFIEKKTSN